MRDRRREISAASLQQSMMKIVLVLTAYCSLRNIRITKLDIATLCTVVLKPAGSIDSSNEKLDVKWSNCSAG